MENSDVKLLTVCATVCLACVFVIPVVSKGYVMDGNGRSKGRIRTSLPVGGQSWPWRDELDGWI